MDRPRIAVVGAGAGGLATAVHLSLAGMPPVLVNRSPDRIHALIERPVVTVEGVWQGEVPLAEATADLSRVASVDVVIVATPATAHRDLARALAPYLTARHLVILHPGRTLGALEFAAALQQAGTQVRAVAETDTLLYTARSHAPGSVRVGGLKRRVRVAALPPWQTGEALAVLRPLGPRFVPAPHVLATGIHNIGAMFHPAPMLLNAARIQAGERFEYYREGITPAVATLVRGLDRERLAVGRAWGVRAEPVETWMRQHYELPPELETLEALVAANPAYAGVMAPETLAHRYLLEDVPTGLVPLANLGRLAGVETPLMEAVIDMASHLVGVDFRRSGRTLERMGLGGVSARRLMEIVMTGLPAPSTVGEPAGLALEALS